MSEPIIVEDYAFIWDFTPQGYRLFLLPPFREYNYEYTNDDPSNLSRSRTIFSGIGNIFSAIIFPELDDVFNAMYDIIITGLKKVVRGPGRGGHRFPYFDSVQSYEFPEDDRTIMRTMASLYTNEISTIVS